MIASRYLPLYRAIRISDWESATKFFIKEPNAVRDPITFSSETALALVVRSSKRNQFLKKLMERMSPEEVAWTDNVGKTALHKAVASGNNVAAKLLVEKNPELPNIEDQYGELAVHLAAIRGNRELVEYLWEVTKLDGDPNPFEGQLGAALFRCLIYGELYDMASTFLQRYPKLASMEPSPVLGIINRRTSFRSGTRLNFFQRLIYSVSQKLHAMFWDVAEKLVPTIKSVRETKLIHHQALNLIKRLCQEVVRSPKAGNIFRGLLLNAATMGISEIVEEILEVFPSAFYFTYQRGQYLLQIAIENRQENVFNLIYQMDENQDYFLSTRDKFKNNALHTAGNFASRQQLSLQASVAGAALQMQRELQWFEAVEKLLHPRNRYARNNEDKTPQDVFTETHNDLVEKGEKWMKDTASSCTIVAALIVTVVFAAAITVPGGINSNGLPIFLNDGVFVLFGVFDALALFSSTASLLMFLSIFTARYGEQDFLYSLPRKLIIGLVTLFLSIIFMMIAFGATLKIVFGYKKEWVVIPVVVLSSVPITLFALLQFPLLLDMIRSTYYPGIFRKRSNRILF
ncbi:hypothetical protein Vadar_000016 [Vaccinium darrowii]|uniref:Uncharacterized protein n=1 Tax=Vaccinium darrowii TaxID=229202 RepID=A0ACB7XEE2_9ERIC|nr:hypothetical protein Vadar_000016 [Vaccinium darrowii]